MEGGNYGQFSFMVFGTVASSRCPNSTGAVFAEPAPLENIVAHPYVSRSGSRFAGLEVSGFDFRNGLDFTVCCSSGLSYDDPCPFGTTSHISAIMVWIFHLLTRRWSTLALLRLGSLQGASILQYVAHRGSLYDDFALTRPARKFW